MKFGFLIFCITINLFSQQFNEKNESSTTVGQIGLTISNIGVLGNSFRGTFVTKTQPSCEYPIGSGIEHLFDGGFWIGAEVRGQKLVSTGAAGDDANGYDPGNAGYEFTSTTPIIERSSLENSKNYSPLAISHQDFIAEFSDTLTRIPNGGPIINEHTQPLNAKIKLESYSWNFSFADYFVILNYKITNIGKDSWKNIFFGEWGDYIVRNVKKTAPRGTDFFSHSAFGFIDSLQLFYVYDYDGDPGFTDSYVAVKVLGGDWRGALIHPKSFTNWPDSLKNYFKTGQTPIDSLRTNIQFWGYKSTDLNLGSPKNDGERYLKMSNQISNSIYEQEIKDKPTNLLSNLAIGPIPEIKSNESITISFAVICAKKNGDRSSKINDSLSQIELIDHINWAQRAYNGEDANGNGIMDSGEDLNLNGKIDRYRLPEPPVSPIVKIIPDKNSATIFWDKRAENSIDPISRGKDFEGYRLYRTMPTTNNNSQNALILMAEIDSAGNKIGSNSGFKSSGNFTILSVPKMFNGDTTKYFYKYEVKNLLNGWQYKFSVTAFDKGDSARNISILESSKYLNAKNIFPGTPINNNFLSEKVFVYPNPYYQKALWDGTNEREKKIYFANLPEKCNIKIYTLAGETVDEFVHDGNNYSGEDSRWFKNNITGGATLAGGEHAWDLISKYDQALATGLYLYSVKNLNTNEIQVGKFIIIK